MIPIDRSMSKMFLDKTREIEIEMLAERSFLDYRFQGLTTARPEDAWFFEMSINNSKIRLEHLHKQFKKFTYFHNVSLGRLDDRHIELDVIKQISPEFILGKPMWETSKLAVWKCPMHNEKTPSFTWYKKDYKFYCFGACGKGGDIIDLVQKMHSVSFLEACKELSTYAQS